MSSTARDAGIAALKSGNAQQAVLHLQQAVTDNPQDAQAHGYLGAAYGQLNMPEKAVQSLTEAARLAPNSAALRYNLGMALERAGRQAEALEAYRQSLAVDGTYERARQALARLGEHTPAAPAASPVAPPPAAPAAAGAPTGLNDFLLPGQGPPVPAAPAMPTPPPSYSAGPSFPPPPGPMNAAGGAAFPAPPSTFEAPGSFPPPPGGLTPLGDWSPPGGAAPNWGPPPQPAPGYRETTESGAMIATAEAPERMLSDKDQLGHCYLCGMTVGVWWGLIGAIVFFMCAMVSIRATDFGRAMPAIIAGCLMCIAFGTLLYGLVGMAGAKSDDAETLCGNVGMGIGILTAAVLLLPFMVILGYMSFALLFGAIWASRAMGRAVGGNIAEMQGSIFVVAHGGKVAITPMR